MARRHMATSSSAPYGVYVYTHHVYVDFVQAAFFPRKSWSKPRADAPGSSPEYFTQTQTNYKCECATSLVFLLALPAVFNMVCQKGFCQAVSSSLPPLQMLKWWGWHRSIRWKWQGQGATTGFTPSISTSHLAHISPVPQMSSHLCRPYSFWRCMHPGALQMRCLCLAALLEQTSSFELVSLSVSI